MLHKQESKSKGETAISQSEHSPKWKRKAHLRAFLFIDYDLCELVSLLANECRDIQIVRARLHHRPR